MHRANPENLSGAFDWLSSQWQIVSGYWTKKYDEAKAKLQAIIGEFLSQRAVLMQMQRRIAYLQNKAERTGNAALRRSALDLENQRRALMDEQTSYEGKLQAAMEKIRMVDGSQAASGGVGQDPVVTPTVILGVAALVVATAALLIYHNKKVNYLHRLLTDVENKVLTPAEAAELGKSSGFQIFGSAGPYLLGAAVVVGVLYYMKRRR
jgi:hypothetical protein